MKSLLKIMLLSCVGTLMFGSFGFAQTAEGNDDASSEDLLVSMEVNESLAKSDEIVINVDSEFTENMNISNPYPESNPALVDTSINPVVLNNGSDATIDLAATDLVATNGVQKSQDTTTTQSTYAISDGAQIKRGFGFYNIFETKQPIDLAVASPDYVDIVIDDSGKGATLAAVNTENLSNDNATFNFIIFIKLFWPFFLVWFLLVLFLLGIFGYRTYCRDHLLDASYPGVRPRHP